MKIKRRPLLKNEQWSKKCKCGHFIPSEYKLCDFCLIEQFALHRTSNPCCDPLGMVDLLFEDEVVPVIRHLLGETVVDINKPRKR